MSNKFRVYVIHSNCTRLHDFFFFILDYGENGYLHSKASLNFQDGGGETHVNKNMKRMKKEKKEKS